MIVYDSRFISKSSDTPLYPIDTRQRDNSALNCIALGRLNCDWRSWLAVEYIFASMIALFPASKLALIMIQQQARSAADSESGQYAKVTRFEQGCQILTRLLCQTTCGAHNPKPAMSSLHARKLSAYSSTFGLHSSQNEGMRSANCMQFDSPSFGYLL